MMRSRTARGDGSYDGFEREVECGSTRGLHGREAAFAASTVARDRRHTRNVPHMTRSLCHRLPSQLPRETRSLGVCDSPAQAQARPLPCSKPAIHHAHGRKAARQPLGATG
eukprot:365164-Chlamydomonas_euryale.AAC.10